MIENLPKDMCDLIASGLKDKIENFTIEKFQSNEKGEGFLGEVFFISIKNKKTGEEHHLVVKQVLPVNNEDSIDLMSYPYKNEIRFYTKVLPTFEKFQKSYSGSEIFYNVPKCYVTSPKRGKEKLILENLKFKNYEMHPKQIPLTTKMYEAIFKLYGKYHGVSFALKTEDSETFLELGHGFANNFLKFVEHGFMSKAIEGVCLKVKDILKENNEVELENKFEKYVTDGVKFFVDAITYKSAYEVMVHGDCWSNNMMFKYNSRGVEDIKMLDFQMSMLASPVLDLMYSFYSGADKENLDHLEYFLQIYYKSLGDTLKQYKLNVEKIYPYDSMKKEWKDLSAFGFIMGLMLWMGKTTDPAEVPNVGDIMEKNIDWKEEIKPNEEKFTVQSLHLVRHMNEHLFL